MKRKSFLGTGHKLQSVAGARAGGGGGGGKNKRGGGGGGGGGGGRSEMERS